jgi:hypothetical protein
MFINEKLTCGRRLCVNTTTTTAVDVVVRFRMEPLGQWGMHTLRSACSVTEQEFGEVLYSDQARGFRLKITGRVAQ